MRSDCMPKAPEIETVETKQPFRIELSLPNLKLEFISGDERFAPCLYIQSKRGQRYFFFKGIFQIKHIFHRWS